MNTKRQYRTYTSEFKTEALALISEQGYSTQGAAKDLDEWMNYYNNTRTHQEKMFCGRTPLETLINGKTIWAEKGLAQI